MQRLDYLSKCLVHPGDRIRNQLQHLTHLANRLRGAWGRYAEAKAWEVRGVARELGASRPDIRGLERSRRDLARRLREAARVRIDVAAARLAAIDSHLKHLNPQLVLERGYSIAVDADGAVVRDAAQLSPGDALKVKFAHGSAQAEVKNTTG
jgi:exodeoxyribonuclease VII large subunit